MGVFVTVSERAARTPPDGRSNQANLCSRSCEPSSSVLGVTYLPLIRRQRTSDQPRWMATLDPAADAKHPTRPDRRGRDRRDQSGCWRTNREHREHEPDRAANMGRSGTDPRSASPPRVSSRSVPLASGQAVRRLTLDQEIEGSNPSSPASSSPNHKVLWSAPTTSLHVVVERRRAVRRRRRRTWFGHPTPLIFGHLIRRPRIDGHLILAGS